ncbi:MAG: PfkB family carbohydrate kinase [Halobacteriales archaeon]|nr:PfkB family carbohydrate kinase [Halobacteriales archaeon]
MSLDVVVVGSAVRDEYYTLSNLPEPDGGAFVRERETAVGGVGANVAVALARLGRDVGLIARVGEADAPTIESHLAAEGVHLDRLRRGDEEPTYSLVLRDGERRAHGGDRRREHAEPETG